mmetsp:Transcript_48468/g.134777  ORF Transcript_48468/g.134777 Transcript_48468/m.134777 type:complete len:92 (-) Transcript_48468:1029-1304(-)
MSSHLSGAKALKAIIVQKPTRGDGSEGSRDGTVAWTRWFCNWRKHATQHDAEMVALKYAKAQSITSVFQVRDPNAFVPKAVQHSPAQLVCR